ncbi:predicted protein [Sclerotinia sclerotiorum 1980 UF-70]|uniref:Uncharacterized protein n=1 Tax=Sclerotinia sclerotiorum (strain ATCC 18683 / 1980 / Ss-1) TaxID=665079 RepID=A7F123_SCLS1|nr:predicted protein [Sclerotinia sclerotiorum 1980 UF-70]EDN95415.1 predicted protein [Sclerotinia sclerotiorum 1980 UF-70]
MANGIKSEVSSMHVSAPYHPYLPCYTVLMQAVVPIP